MPTKKNIDLPLEEDENPFDTSPSEESSDSPEEPDAVKSTEPESEEGYTKPKKSRRTKAEIEAESLAEARKLLESNGYFVTDRAPGSGAPFVPVHMPVNAHSGDIVGSLGRNPAGVSILTLSVRRWVGEAPFIVQAAQLDDIASVLTALRAGSEG